MYNKVVEFYTMFKINSCLSQQRQCRWWWDESSCICNRQSKQLLAFAYI